MSLLLSLFDLDNTLLSCDSDYEWGRFLVEHGVLDAGEYAARNQDFYDQYKSGTLDIHEYLAFALRPLADNTPEDLANMHSKFMSERIRPSISGHARTLVKAHIDSGALCALVTATNSFVTAPIAKEFGIQNLIATEPEVLHGRFTGRTAGEPCFREGKVRRVTGWLASLGQTFEDFDESTFYSDSHNDLPLMSRVKSPVAVDPDSSLLQEARRRGWAVISLRDK
jgi:HAD superfamily hydrolase (TIGR01490 family)